MIYLINGKYYIKVGKDFTEVELVFTDNDVDLKATNNKIENNGNIVFEQFNFLDKKQELLEKHNENKYDEEEFSFNRKISKRSKENSFK